MTCVHGLLVSTRRSPIVTGGSFLVKSILSLRLASTLHFSALDLSTLVPIQVNYD